MPTVEIAWLWPDGDGGAPWDGGTVRIPGTVPGDVVEFAPGERRGRTLHATVATLATPSARRQVPPCPWDARCGGCDLSALAPDARRDAFARTVMRVLRLDAVPEVVPSPRADYRARIQLAIEGGAVGYHASRSHELVAIEACAIARPEIRAAHERLRALPPGALAGLGRVELRSDGERVVFAFTAAGRPDPAALASLGDVAIDGRAVHGDPVLWLPTDGLALRASPRSFFQVNPEVNAALVAHVRDAVLGFRAERVLDLYAGIGNFALPIAARRVPVTAVELEGQAIGDLQASAARAGLTVQAIASDVGRFDLSRHAFDVAVLDPPRAGAPGVLARVARNRPRGIVLVACAIASAARDLGEAVGAGYRITGVRCFDMFPDTHHGETVITLSR
jgi:23S rRNA (uracil1939-C5)-methyltransferase